MPSWSPSTPSSSIPLGSEEDSHLLDQSLPSPDPFDASSHIHTSTGPGGADLSLSELSLSDKPYSRDGPRFSLLAPPPAPLYFSADQSAIIEGEEYEETGDTSIDGHDDANNTIMARVVAEKTREEKLQSDLFILRKLNASFAVLNDALRATKGATEQVAEQLSQTDALLDKYANMLAKSETVTRLIFDERWGGADADADEELLVKEREEALERARLEREREEEVARREAEERARREAEEAVQREAEELAKQEAAAALAAKAPAKGRGTGIIGSGVRGVRGTRATATAMASRGMRGSSRTASTTSTIPRTRSASATGSVGSGGSGARPSSSASRGSSLSRGVPRRG
ncbi:hypothetical protein L210DRAFT_3530350 [Boletus edulis BED1]|uniref:DASH complex subunit DUO1 n=1 Tax=Boletus edulis BED1 TaxID=1328754 RepID=A0AAD4C0I6_BOLED|nr:hypothetical protein L210DRAFT_3530350 [Boletus edulis BED1]